VYSKFPQSAQLILGNGLAAGTLTAVFFNIIFNHLKFGAQPAATPEAEPPPVRATSP
jgi:xanthine/uracil permease